MSELNYTAPGTCTNCSRSVDISFLRGELADFGKGKKCPMCDCNTVFKVYKEILSGKQYGFMPCSTDNAG